MLVTSSNNISFLSRINIQPLTLFQNHPKCLIWVFQFWHFPPLFVKLKLACLVILFGRKHQVFINSPNWLFLAFLIQLLMRSSLRSQYWMRLFSGHWAIVSKRLEKAWDGILSGLNELCLIDKSLCFEDSCSFTKEHWHPLKLKKSF